MNEKCPFCKESKYIRYVKVRTKSRILTYVGCSNIKCCYCKLVRDEVDPLKMEDLKEMKKVDYV
mgnify:CR=1 FL=1